MAPITTRRNEDIVAAFLERHGLRGSVMPMNGGFSGAELFRADTDAGPRIVKVVARGPLLDHDWQFATTELRAYRFLQGQRMSFAARLHDWYVSESQRLIVLLLEDGGEQANPANAFEVLADVHRQMARLTDVEGSKQFMRVSLTDNAWTWSWMHFTHNIPPELSRLVKEIDWLLAMYDCVNALVPCCLLHGDLAIENIVQRGDTYRFVDWESLCYGPISRDIASLYVSIFGLNFDNLGSELSRYEGVAHAAMQASALRTAVVIEACRSRAERIAACLRVGMVEQSLEVAQEVLDSLEKIRDVAPRLW